MRFSQSYIPTQKEIPSDALIPSHQLMLRAGLVRQLAAGVYSYLPMGWRVMKKVIAIIREEMDKIGGQELQLPVLNPVEIWDETGRNTDFGDEMFRLKDRRERTLVLAPTHEEVVCDLARHWIQSYRDLPQIWYQIQTKMRDEPRPRSGVIRTRQFLMKDSYTLDADAEGLDKAYGLHAQAYRAIFTRCGLRFHMVTASSGLMGGRDSEEFMIESESGEDTLVLCSKCGYAANLQVSVSIPTQGPLVDVVPLKKIHTPGRKTIEDVSSFLGVPPNRLMKSLLFIKDDTPFLVLIRGDHELNETKVMSIMGGPIRPVHPEEVADICGAPVGFVGPIGMKRQVRILADSALQNQHALITGANEIDHHFEGIEWNRDLSVKNFFDLKNTENGETCIRCQGKIKIVHAIELGHIFKLGTKYAEAMKALYVTPTGESRPIVMGSYGIGVERIVAALIEQDHDDKGIVWNPVITPYHVHLIPVNTENPRIMEKALMFYERLNRENIETLMDDRPVSPGFKFKDADLLGIPVQAILGEKGLNQNGIEIKIRKTGERMVVPENDFLPTVRTLLKF